MNCQKSLKWLWIFIIVYLLIWVGGTLLLHSSTSISPDTMENIIWGMHPSLMYDKHPGLGALLLKPLTMVFTPLLADLIASSTCVLITWFYVFKILRLSFRIEEAIFITLLSSLSLFYMGDFFIQYNQNIILLPFWSASGFYFTKAIEQNKTIDWFLTTISLGLGFYAKFQIGLIAIAMLIFLILHYDKKYTKNIILSFILGIILVAPGFISLYKIDFATIKYMISKTDGSDNSFIFNIFFGIADGLFQLLNFVFSFVILTFLFRKKQLIRYIKSYSTSDKVIIFIGLIPHSIHIILEMLKGPVPAEWFFCNSTFILPALYVLLKIQLVKLNFKKLVLFGLLINLLFFIIFNIITFTDNKVENNNIGNGIAIAADEFLINNRLKSPNFVSGYWKFSYPLAVFMKEHPEYIRNIDRTNFTGTMLLVFPGCDKQNLTPNFKIIKQQCIDVKLTDKFINQYKKFNYYYVDKEN